MFKYLNKLSLVLPMVNKISLSASSRYFNKFIFLCSAPKRNVVSSSEIFKTVPDTTNIPPDQRGIFVKNFEELDENHDGFLTFEENKQAIKKSIDFLTDRHINTIFDSKTSNQRYSLDQYLDYFGKIVNFKNLVDDGLHFMFLINDFDKDGKFSFEEVSNLMDAMIGSENKLDKENEALSFFEYDEDEDGYLTFEEVKKWLWAEHDPFKS